MVILHVTRHPNPSVGNGLGKHLEVGIQEDMSLEHYGERVWGQVCRVFWEPGQAAGCGAGCGGPMLEPHGGCWMLPWQVSWQHLALGPCWNLSP